MGVSRACPQLLSVCFLSCPGGSHPCGSSFLLRNGTSSFSLYCISRNMDEKLRSLPREYRHCPKAELATLRLVTLYVALGLFGSKAIASSTAFRCVATSVEPHPKMVPC